MKNKLFSFMSKIFNVNRIYLKSFFKKVWEIICKPEMMVLPGQLAFFVILSFVPLLSVITLIGNSLGISVLTVSDFLSKIFTSVKFDLIIPNIYGQEFNLKFIIVLCITFYIAANGANSVIVASNQIYGIKQSDYIRRRVKAILVTLLLCALYLFVLIVPLLGRKIILSFDYFNLKFIIKPIITIIRGPLTWFIVYYFIKTIYVISPDKSVKRTGLNFGALFATVFWVIATYLYSGWINNFNSYNKYYGSLSTIAILMLWIYWLCYIFVIGLCLNVKVENDELEKTGIIKTK